MRGQRCDALAGVVDAVCQSLVLIVNFFIERWRQAGSCSKQML